MSRFVDFIAVKAAVTMLQLLEHYGLAAGFKRTGNSLSGPCPLHGGENRTQFRVSLEKNCWNCFGTCKGGGNVLDFVARRFSAELRKRRARKAGAAEVALIRLSHRRAPSVAPPCSSSSLL